jgi:hypothetical protein
MTQMNRSETAILLGSVIMKLVPRNICGQGINSKSANWLGFIEWVRKRRSR